MSLAALVVLSASAVTLNLQSTDTPYPGVTIQKYRTSSPGTDTWVARIDLCNSSIHVDATKPTTTRRSVGAWANDAGVQFAINGDFYKTSPLRVYGRAIGNGITWPLDHTGADPQYSSEWYYKDYGWIAFGHDRVEFDHTKWIKNNRTTSEGWDTAVGAEPPAGTLALVSGFPELVTEGAVYTCSSATANSCFPDRTDMRSRHPRSAMGITADRETLIFAVVDGRRSSSAGMYGAELADLMGQLGAWQAFNLDGGGSTQMWVKGDGYLNQPSDGSPRSVANHWGVFAGGGHDRGTRPGSCVSQPACETIPDAGGTLDDSSACFRTYGPSQYWREESDGHGGHLFWTNAWKNEVASNWAWWQTELAQAGEYEVEVYIDPDWGVFDDVDYRIVADGTEHYVTLDQGAASGWTSLGAFDFAQGGDQYVALYDAVDYSPGSNQHIVADAVRLTRLDLPVPQDDPADDPVEDPDGDDPLDSGLAADTGLDGPGADEVEGIERGDEGGVVGSTWEPMGCSTVGGSTRWLWVWGAFALLWLRRGE